MAFMKDSHIPTQIARFRAARPLIGVNDEVYCRVNKDPTGTQRSTPMGRLVFLDEAHFDGRHVRFIGIDAGKSILCGVTANALKYCNCGLPHYGLIPAEDFVAAYQRRMIDIHHIAAEKHEKGEFEPQGDIRVVIHRRDLAP
ncbi:MAG: DUF1488 family protein [Parvibaculaceae bacterium]